MPEHSQPEYLVYFFNPDKPAFVLPGGGTAQVEVKAGEVRWLTPLTHSEENIDTQGTRILIIGVRGKGRLARKIWWRCWATIAPTSHQ